MQEKAKIRMMQQKDSGKSDSYWSDLWGKPKEYRDSGENQLRVTDQPHWLNFVLNSVYQPIQCIPFSQCFSCIRHFACAGCHLERSISKHDGKGGFEFVSYI